MANMVKICVLASGSEGNAFFVGTDKTRILIDAGISVSEIAYRLARIGENVSELDAVLVTHEHGDHINGLATLTHQVRPPIYLTRKTSEAISADPKRASFIRK